MDNWYWDEEPAILEPEEGSMPKKKQYPPSPNPGKFFTTKEDHERRKQGWERKHGPLPSKKKAAVDSPSLQEEELGEEPLWWQELKRQHGGVLYHATPDEDAQWSITHEGLIPWDAEDNPRGSKWSDHLRPRPGHVYLADEGKIGQIAGGQQKPYMVAIDMNALDHRRLAADEDSVSGHGGDNLNLTPEQRGTYDSEIGRVVPRSHWYQLLGGFGNRLQAYREQGMDNWKAKIQAREDLQKYMDEQGIPHFHSYGDWANYHGFNEPNHIQHSLDSHGTIAYQGHIPPEAIIDRKMMGGECPNCGAHSPDISEYEHEGYCENCGWSSDEACPSCQSMSYDGTYCPTCGEGVRPGDAIFFNGHPAVFHSAAPFMVSTYGEEPFEVLNPYNHAIEPIDQPDYHLYPWMDPQHPDYPPNKYPSPAPYNVNQFYLQDQVGMPWQEKYQDYYQRGGSWHFGNARAATHFHPWTGLPCSCPWGVKLLPQGHRRIAGQQYNKLRKAPDKAFRTPEGQAFLNDLGPYLGDEYDALAPYIANRWKRGEIAHIPQDVEYTHPAIPDAVDRPTLAKGLYVPQTRYVLESPLAENPAMRYNWIHLNRLLPDWHQWYQARQHPTRQGVNIMDKNFSVFDLQNRVRQHQEDLERQQQIQQDLQYGNVDYRFPNGWHVRHLTPYGEDTEAALRGEGRAMNHCVGDFAQPYQQCARQGDIDVYSLRDPKGWPHGTWHTNNSEHSIAEVFGHADRSLSPEHNAMYEEWAKARGYDPEPVGHMEQAEDEQIELPPAEDVSSYLDLHGHEGDYYNYIPDDANYGENTEILHQEPQYGQIVQDMIENTPAGGWNWREQRSRTPEETRQNVFYTARDWDHLDEFNDAIRGYTDCYGGVGNLEPHEQAAIHHWNQMLGNVGQPPAVKFPPPEPGEYNPFMPPPEVHPEQQQWQMFSHVSGVSHAPGQMARGVVTPEGEVHTWPEDWGTHNGFIYNVLGDYSDLGYDKFVVNSQGLVHGLSDPAHQGLVRAALQPAGGPPPISPYDHPIQTFAGFDEAPRHPLG